MAHRELQRSPPFAEGGSSFLVVESVPSEGSEECEMRLLSEGRRGRTSRRPSALAAVSGSDVATASAEPHLWC